MRLGIIGGVSPFAFSEFYDLLCEEYRKKTDKYPAILIYSMEVSIEEENEFVTNSIDNETMEKIVNQIKIGCKLFKENNIDTVTICCNTLSDIFYQIANEFGFKNIITPVMAVNQYIKLNDAKYLLLSTSYTSDNELYSNTIKLSDEDQKKISTFIKEKINNISISININEIISKYEFDCIILGCTDISCADLKYNSNVLDSNKCLLNTILTALGVR